MSNDLIKEGRARVAHYRGGNRQDAISADLIERLVGALDTLTAKVAEERQGRLYYVRQYEAANNEVQRLTFRLDTLTSLATDLAGFIRQVHAKWIGEANHHIKDCACTLCATLRRAYLAAQATEAVLISELPAQPRPMGQTPDTKNT